MASCRARLLCEAFLDLPLQSRLFILHSLLATALSGDASDLHSFHEPACTVVNAGDLGVEIPGLKTWPCLCTGIAALTVPYALCARAVMGSPVPACCCVLCCHGPCWSSRGKWSSSLCSPQEPRLLLISSPQESTEGPRQQGHSRWPSRPRKLRPG